MVEGFTRWNGHQRRCGGPKVEAHEAFAGARRVLKYVVGGRLRGCTTALSWSRLRTERSDGSWSEAVLNIGEALGA